MENLILSAKETILRAPGLPFSIYCSIKEQHIANVPIIKPLLICVLDGCKKLGKDGEVTCSAGSFIFLSNSPSLEMRNIPEGTEYFALLIEFDYSDFACFTHQPMQKQESFQGEIDSTLQYALQQFVEWSSVAPTTMWGLRRQEILQLLDCQGYTQVRTIMEPPSFSHKVYHTIRAQCSQDLSAADISSQLAMSESTLRRKLTAENTSLQTIKDQVKLGYGLHLVQTTHDAIGLIAEQCGYHSQSRFTDKFKQLFGITPTELRKTRMID